MKITESKTYIATPPGFTIKEMMEDQGKSLQEFAHLMGLSEEDAAALIEGEAQLTDAVAARLEAALGMNTRFWLGLERNYREKLVKVAEENAQGDAQYGYESAPALRASISGELCSVSGLKAWR